MKFHNLLRNIKSWSAAFIIAVVICNGVVYFYDRPAGWINRTEAFSTAIWNPGSKIVMGTEGHGVHKVDSRGYINSHELENGEKGYVLTVGSSFTQGKEVEAGKRFSDLLGMWMKEDGISVYNVSQDAYFFPQLIKGFQALVEEFPDASTIILEISSTDFSKKDMEDALNQRRYDSRQSGRQIKKGLSIKEKLKIKLKESLPIYNLAKKQVNAIKSKDAQPGIGDGKLANQELVDKALKKIRSQFSGNILVFYHPSVEIQQDGSLKILKGEFKETFKQLCIKNNILFLDVSDAFLEKYESDFIVPYGFNNTIMGTGHFNEAGHLIVAEEIYGVLKGVNQ